MSDNVVKEKKYNDACIKLFEFLKMLYDGEVDYKWVIDHFSDGNYDGTSNTHVTLNKYLNAMKIFGIRVKKVQNKYILQSPLYKIDFTNNDIKSIVSLKNASKLLPKGKYKASFDKFVHDLEIRFDESAQNSMEIFENAINSNLKFNNTDITKQIQLCEKYCRENHKLEIIYNDETGNEYNLLCSPVEVTYVKRKVCLKALGNNGNRVYEIPIELIKSIKQLPSSSSTKGLPMTVLFRIKGRLALNYKMRDDERLEQLEADGSKLIVNKNEDLNNLLKRLMRYGTQCEIISPKFLREEMMELINKTLSNYQ